MPKVNKEVVHRVQLTEGDIDRLEDGRKLTIDLGSSVLKLQGPVSGSDGGDSSNNIVQEVEDGASPSEVAEDRENVTEEDVAQLVEQAQQEAADPNIIEKTNG